MKRGGIGGGKRYLVFIFVLLFILALIFIAYFTGFLGKITGLFTKNVGLNITVGAPQIIQVMNGSATMSLNQGPLNTSRIINFTVYHGAGSLNLNDSTAMINITLVGGVGEVTRNHTICTRYNSSTNYATYNCSMIMWWFDGAGNWNITASILDNNSNMASNSSTTLYVGSLQGFEILPTNLSWPSIGAGSTNQTSNNDPLNLTNTGNQPVGNATGTTNVSINATDLKGEQNSAYIIFANNFSVGITTGGAGCSGAVCLECGGGLAGNLSKNMYTNISAVLPKGNYTIGDTTTGRSQLYFCLRIAGLDLTSQAYSTVNQGAWTIKIY